MATCFKTLIEYLYPDNGHKTFIIPNYQRGYKWSVRLGEEQTSVDYLIESLKKSYKESREQQYFLQGVTVTEEDDNIIIIDGQQRTTTLYLLLWCLNPHNIKGNWDIDLKYNVRKESGDFLKKLKDPTFDYMSSDPSNRLQDIYYFKQAIKQIENAISDLENKEDFTDYLLNKISLMYIVVDKKKAVKTFTMMNGSKATMQDEELVKAELLHIVSLPEKLNHIPVITTLNDTFAVFKEIAAVEWDTNALRSKYAREWDKWLYWWNRQDVKDCFNTNRPLGLLLKFYYKKEGQGAFSFRKFKNLLPDNNKKNAKDTFKKIRDLQKDFEDIFNDPKTYNYLRLALITSSSEDDKFDIIGFYMEHKRVEEALRNYSNLRLIDCTHKEITDKSESSDDQLDNKDKCEEKAKEMYRRIAKPIVYESDGHDDLLKQLLKLNVREYNRLNNGHGIKFDFGIWRNKSLEHIYPKSRFFHEEQNEFGETLYIRGDGTQINKEDTESLNDSSKVFTNPDKYSEHCIGNLVLLYGKDNSAFGALSFEEKKEKFFNNERPLDSRNLLHTISAFSSSTWSIKDIEENTEKTLQIIRKDYNIEEL